MFCLLTLPFQIAFGLLLLPFVLLKWTIKLLVGLALLPFVLLFSLLVFGFVAFAIATVVLVPLIPFALGIGFILLLVRIATRPIRAAI